MSNIADEEIEGVAPIIIQTAYDNIYYRDCVKTFLEPKLEENYAKTKTENENLKKIAQLSNLEDTEKEALKAEFLELKKREENLLEEINTLRSLNYQLQNDVIERVKNLNTPPSERLLNQNFENAAVGDRINGNVHLGKGVWLPIKCFDNAMSKRKDSIFIKEIAYAVFGEATLINSSVTGAACNRLPNLLAKPALDATKMLAIEDIMRYRREQKGGEISHENLIKIIHKSIREKIQDLTRPYRNKNLANINLANVEIFDENMQQLEIVKIESGADHGLAE